MPTGLTRAPATHRTCEDRTNADLLRHYLQAYWLRPENALWMTLRSRALAACPVDSPAIDLACGDGVFSFLHCGGRFDPAFDVFGSVTALERRPGDRADMFDHCDDAYRPPIVQRPTDGFDVGTDVKPSSLTKAGRLGFYARLVQHDNNGPLPFDDAEFQTVYCNAAYWVTDIAGLLSEMRRIVRPAGRVILQLKLEAVRNYNLDAYGDRLGARFLEIIGGRRLESWPTLATRGEWERRFAAAGLTVESVVSVVSPTHAFLWDVGLRPIAPLLVRMANAVTPQTRAAVKHDWVDLFFDLLRPMADAGFDLSAQSGEPPELQYVLTRR